MNFDFEYWKKLEPMRYFDNPNPATDTLKKKRQDMLDNKNNEYIATQKWDGEWSMCIRGAGNQVLIKSRSISKVTGEYGDKTGHLPQFVEEMMSWPEGTVVLAEVCWPELGKMSTDVGVVMRCLPERAVKRQAEDQWLVGKVFDVLCWGGEDISKHPYEQRLNYVNHYFSDFNKVFTRTNIYIEEFSYWADTIISQGGEGIVIYRKDYGYEPGKRASWKTLKVKQKMPVMELKVLKTIDPTKEYQGKDIESWEYWEGDTAVSKAYYYGWKMGITVDFNGTLVDASSGLTDADREWLSTPEAQEAIKNGQVYASIRAMCVAALGGLRHPVIDRIRIMDYSMLDGVEIQNAQSN